MLEKNLRVSRLGVLALILLSAVAGSAAVSAQTLTTLVNFNGGNGAIPDAGLSADANGDLFGTTAFGGASGNGVVFEIAKTTNGYASTPTTLVSFNWSDGSDPLAGLIADANGDLFGTTAFGGASGNGVVFEIAKTSTGYASTPTTLVTFDGSDGAEPVAGLIADASGNFFGTTAYGGPSWDPLTSSYGYGTVFEIAKTASGYASTPTTLVSFNGSDGENPYSGVIADASGNLFGTTSVGGGSGDGTVFEIAKTASGYASTPTTLVSFDGSKGANSYYADLIFDPNGDLFGTTYWGGDENEGTVFEIVKTASGYASTPTIIVSFDGSDGANPRAGLIVDAGGNLFGTTQQGGSSYAPPSSYGFGTIFEIVRTTSGYANSPTTLISFDFGNDIFPGSSLIADINGNLFGTTSGDGVSEDGTADLTGSGFVPPEKFAGKSGSANCKGKSISALAQTYGGLAHAAAALGYASVQDFKNAVAQYCSE